MLKEQQDNLSHTFSLLHNDPFLFKHNLIAYCVMIIRSQLATNLNVTTLTAAATKALNFS